MQVDKSAGRLGMPEADNQQYGMRQGITMWFCWERRGYKPLTLFG